MSKKHKTKNPNQSRSVELFNPSAYTGYFVRQFNPRQHYTRTNVTFPMYNQMSITKAYQTGPDKNIKKYDLKNLLMTPWNVPNIYPLKNRRLMLI
jgi:hypothetical protein